MHLALDDARHLFHAPEADPLQGRFAAESGFDTVLRRLKRERLPKEGRPCLTVALPAAQIGNEMTGCVQAAIAGHAETLIGQQQEELALLRREMAQSFKVGGLFLAACLLLSALVDRLTILSPFVQTMLRESLVIAGWVGLWHPVELLLYGWWPHRFRIDRLKHVKGADVRVVPAGSA